MAKKEDQDEHQTEKDKTILSNLLYMAPISELKKIMEEWLKVMSKKIIQDVKK
jgi:hypothetical protein